MADLIREPALLDEVAPDLARLRVLFVNLYFFGDGDSWVLVDAGLQGSAERIRRAAAERFGERSRPRAIVLTHAHFDHVGALETLADAWDVPVYAHLRELPYLTGQSDYPPPDPTVGGGAMALLSWAYPRKAIDLGRRVRALPADGSVPHMPGWSWIHTPGHTPGHISLFRQRDRCLIAGDAFVTTKQESLLAVATQAPELHGPPAYFTIDWELARESVRRLAALDPEIAATGHGVPFKGAGLRRALDRLAAEFDRLAVPSDGRYVREPALADERGVLYVPPPTGAGRTMAALGLVALAGVAALVLHGRNR